MPSDFRILGPQVKNGEEGRGMEGRRERGELGRREGMEKGVARPNDISDAGTDGAGPGGGDGELKRGRRETGRTRAAWRH